MNLTEHASSICRRKTSGWLKALVVMGVIIGTTAFQSAQAQVMVKGCFRKDGTYVSPHFRSKPDGIPFNNYNFPGNYNPNTGRITKGNADTYLKHYYRRRSSRKQPGYALPDPW